MAGSGGDGTATVHAQSVSFGHNTD
jgi:hypothetical protein